MHHVVPARGKKNIYESGQQKNNEENTFFHKSIKAARMYEKSKMRKRNLLVSRFFRLLHLLYRIKQIAEALGITPFGNSRHVNKVDDKQSIRAKNCPPEPFIFIAQMHECHYDITRFHYRKRNEENDQISF